MQTRCQFLELRSELDGCFPMSIFALCNGSYRVRVVFIASAVATVLGLWILSYASALYFTYRSVYSELCGTDFSFLAEPATCRTPTYTAICGYAFLAIGIALAMWGICLKISNRQSGE